LKDSPALDPKEFDAQFGALVCGIDEVGRGPLVGPVVSACVHIPAENLNDPLWSQITDSKKISEVKREKLFEPIKALCIFGLGQASAQEVDALNIHHATLLAMKRAFEGMDNNFSSFRDLSAESIMRSDPADEPRDNDAGEEDDLSELLFRREGGEILKPNEDSSSLSLCRNDIKDLTALVDGKFAPDLPCSIQTVIKGDSLSLSIAAASIIAKVTRDRMMKELAREYPYYGWEKNNGYGTKAHMEGLNQHGLTPHHRMSYAPCAALKNKPLAAPAVKSLK